VQYEDQNHKQKGKEKPRTYDIGNPDPGLEQAQISGKIKELISGFRQPL
jgi:hypothetical protein